MGERYNGIVEVKGSSPFRSIKRLLHQKTSLKTARKVGIVAKHKRNVWDELLEVGRRMLKELDKFLDPKAQSSRKPARVPIPARNHPRKPDERN